MDIQQQKSWKILLIGDHCVDIYHYGVCERLSPEGPVPILKEIRVEKKMGMSSNVRMNLRNFGIEVVHIHNGDKIEKHRIVDSNYNHHLLRYDVGEDTLLREIKLSRLDNFKNLDAVVISDYNKGFLRHNSIKKICEKFHEIPVFVDTKKSDLTCFEKCIIKINKKEFESIKKLPKKSEIIITLGDKGAMYQHTIYPTIKTEVFDVCGAGDVFLSGLVYGFLDTKNLEKAIEIANICASFSVGKMGTYVVTQEDLKNIGVIN